MFDFYGKITGKIVELFHVKMQKNNISKSRYKR